MYVCVRIGRLFKELMERRQYLLAPLSHEPFEVRHVDGKDAVCISTHSTVEKDWASLISMIANDANIILMSLCELLVNLHVFVFSCLMASCMSLVLISQLPIGIFVSV